MKVPSILFKIFFARVILLLFFTHFSLQSNATHMMGADITYKHIGFNTYEFVVKVYRDCRGVNLETPDIRIKCVSNSNNGDIIAHISNPRLVNIKSITPSCISENKPCDPPNTQMFVTEPRIEEHTYSFIYSFSKAIDELECYRIQVGVGLCCRNNAITTGASGNDFWTYCEIDLLANNSSPTLTTYPIAILCCNQPFNYNIGALDNVDFDSLSYSWTQPLQYWGNVTTWNPTHNYKNPFTVYYPPGYDRKKGPDPTTDPPIGLFLDPTTGDLIFTPVLCNETTIACLKITEWRKDIRGKYQVIGETHRDMQFIITDCPSNNPPIIKAPYTYNVCATNTLCFNILTDDITVVLPPSSPPPPPLKPDSVKLSWNKGIIGATFTILNPLALHQTARFCWTPKESQASDIPYTFTVTARDNACPRNALTVKLFSIKVNKTSSTQVSIDTLICGSYVFKSKIPINFKGNPSYLWEVLDEKRQLVDATHHYFKSNKGIKSTKPIDTIQFKKSGTYIIHHRINNLPLNCPVDYFDTLVVPNIDNLHIITPDIDVCWGNNMDFMLLNDPKYNGKITWTHDGDSNIINFSNKQSSTINPTTLSVKSKTNSSMSINVYCTMKAKDFCPDVRDTMVINIHPNPEIIIGVNKDDCVPHTSKFEVESINAIDASKLSYDWNFNNEGGSNIRNPNYTFAKPGKKVIDLTVTSDEGCKTSAKLEVNVFPLPIADFIPNPNNVVKKDYPYFEFENKSTTPTVLNSRLVKSFWDFGDIILDNDTSTNFNSFYYYRDKIGFYYVSLIVQNNYGCLDTITKLVIIEPDILIFIPNVFTPDNSGPIENNKFNIEASGFETFNIIIFNRWGEKLYESNSIYDSWDGHYKNTPVQMDTYIYHITITSYLKKTYTYSGTVNLIK